MPLPRRLTTALAALAVALGPTSLAAQSPACRQALALALDVSGSVNAQEYRLQIDGLAAALSAPEVARAILANPAAPLRLLVFEWSGPSDQRILLDWTEVSDAATLASIVGRLAGAARQPATPATALGTAMATGAQLLARQPTCWRHTLDISGDGESNTGPRPQDVADLPALADLTINALVIGSDSTPDTGGPSELAALTTYFENLVIRGPAAFVEQAHGFRDYESAMIRKLLRETEGMVIGQLATPGAGTRP